MIELRIPAAALAAVIRRWTAAGNTIDSLPGSSPRIARAILAGERQEVGVDTADRLLVALGMPEALNDLAPYQPTKRSGTWTAPHPLRKLTPEQVAAAHRLHWDGGLSIRELGRQLYERLGYSSAKSCAMALSTAFARAGLHRRDRIAATVAASTTHGRGSRADKAAYKRWHRETFGPWPSDSTGRAS